MVENPKVSIIIPVYNGSNYIREAIESAIQQDYENIEIIIVNDGSDDKNATENIIFEYIEKVRYFKKENGGVSTALNLAIEEMEGDFFSWLSHDDVYAPNKVSSQINLLKQLPNKHSIIYSDFYIIDQKTKVTGQLEFEDAPSKNSLRLELLRHNFIHGCTTLIPKKCFDIVGKFDNSLRTTQDLEILLRLAMKFPFVHLNQKIIYARMHESRDTVTLSSKLIFERENLIIHYIPKITDAEWANFKKGNKKDNLKLLSTYFVENCNNRASRFCRKLYESESNNIIKTIAIRLNLQIRKSVLRFKINAVKFRNKLATNLGIHL